ncbi:unnamed protein product [Ectocarpus sp. 12 AP-2014]
MKCSKPSSGVNLLSFNVSTAAGNEQLSCKTLSHLEKQRTTRTIYIYIPSGRFATEGRYHNAPPLPSLSSPSPAAETTMRSVCNKEMRSPQHHRACARSKRLRRNDRNDRSKVLRDSRDTCEECDQSQRDEINAHMPGTSK